jgi:hypothetical protein
MAQKIKHDRRRFLGTAATAIAAAQVGMVGAADAQFSKKNAADTAGIRPFRINVPEEALIDLRRRLAATRWRYPTRNEQDLNVTLNRIDGCVLNAFATNLGVSQ